jgi:thioester reductase-like protein
VAYLVPAAGDSPDRNDLKTYLAQTLPPYMVPPVFVFLDRMPLNRNGKIDRKALPAPEGEYRPEHSFAAPRSDTEERLAAIWEEVLEVSPIGADDNFFELGGHSLLAIQVLSRVREIFAIELPMRSVFDRPTVAAQAELILAGGREPAEDNQPPDFEREARLDPEIRVAAAAALPASPPRAVFLTGATGFLGAHLLQELLERTDAEVRCLVRAASPEEGLTKLGRTLERYGIRVPLLPDRVVPVCGDLEKPYLGLSIQEFFALSGVVETVFHSAAVLSDAQPYEFLKSANVGGTREVLRLSCLGQAKRLHYVSTNSVFGQAISPKPAGFCETDFIAPGEHLQDGYDQAKWVAEALVHEARCRGLPVNVYRPSHIVGHSLTGSWNTDDFVCRMLKGCVELGRAPDDQEVDMVTVDYVARAIVAVATSPDAVGQTLHLTHPNPPSTGRLFGWLRDLGYPLELMPYSAWGPQVAEALRVRKDHPLYPLVSGLQPQQDPNPDVQVFDSRATAALLSGLGVGFIDFDRARIALYVGRLIAAGFLPPPVS